MIGEAKHMKWIPIANMDKADAACLCDVWVVGRPGGAQRVTDCVFEMDIWIRRADNSNDWERVCRSSKEVITHYMKFVAPE